MGFRRASTSLLTLLALSACGGQGQLDGANGDVADATLGADAAAGDATTLQDGTRAPRDVENAGERDARFDASDPRAGAIDAAWPFECPELANANPWEDLTGTHTLADRGEVLTCAHVATFT